MKNHNLPLAERNPFSPSAGPGCDPDERLLRYWRSLLTVKPTGNAMVDAGFHEEVRSALRDALHCLQDLSRPCRCAAPCRSAARPANVDFGR